MGFRLVILDDTLPLREIVPGEKAVAIGRAPECEVVLNDPLVTRRHALIQKRGEDVFIEDNESQFGTILNGKQIPTVTPVNLRDGDVLQFGQVKAICRFEVDGDSPETALENASFASQANARILLLEGEVIRRRAIAGTSTLIGSGPHCDVQLYDRSAPQEQALIRGRSGNFFVEPRSPSQPPLLNESQHPVHSIIELPSNSTLLLRGAQILFLYEFDAQGNASVDPLRNVPRRRLLRHVADQSGLTYNALRQLTKDRSKTGQSLGEILVEKSLVTPLFWRVLCTRLGEFEKKNRLKRWFR